MIHGVPTFSLSTQRKQKSEDELRHVHYYDNLERLEAPLTVVIDGVSVWTEDREWYDWASIIEASKEEK
jgi:hypothetical protein